MNGHTKENRQGGGNQNKGRVYYGTGRDRAKESNVTRTIERRQNRTNTVICGKWSSAAGDGRMRGEVTRRRMVDLHKEESGVVWW